MKKITTIYKRLRYWRQIKQGFGLLEDLGERVEFTLVDAREFTKNRKK